MKKLKYIIPVLTALMISCDDFLTCEPKSIIFSGQLYASEESIESALIGLYTTIVSTSYYGGIFQETLIPNSVYGVSGVDPTNSQNAEGVVMSEFKHDASSSFIEPLYSQMYQSIGFINDFIYNLEESSVSNEVKNRFAGEARFLRAVVYFDAVRMWGSVPLILTNITSTEDMVQPKVAIEKIFDAIIADLDFAWDYMPKKGEQKTGYPFNYAAKALLAKVYLHMGTSEYMFEGRPDPYTSTQRQEFFTKSYQSAKTVYDADVYKLYYDYDKLWRTQSRNTEESILEFQFNNPTSYNRWGYRIIPQFYTVNTKNNSANKHLRPSKVIYFLHNKRYQNDPRLTANYIVNGYNYNEYAGGTYRVCYPNDNAAIRAQQELYPILRKYIDPDWAAGFTSKMNWIHYRYADLILTMAEAANEIDDPDGVKIDLVNKVLSRARGMGVSPPDWTSSMEDKDKFRDSIMYERLFEMPIEGHEWFDVRRRGKERFIKIGSEYNTIIDTDYVDGIEGGTKTTGDLTGGNTTPYDVRRFIPVDETSARKFLFLPIPQAEIDQNLGMGPEDQNWGYR